MTRLRISDTDIDRLARPEGVAEGAVVSVFRVPPEQAGQRLDVFLQGELKRTSRTRTQFIVRNSAFDPKGKRLRPNHRVQADEHFLLWRPPWDEDPVPTDVPIVFEDEHLFAVNKPALLPVHPTARYHKNTLIKILKDARPGQFVSLGHRLDRETSGVLVCGKSAAADRALKMKIEARAGVQKSYRAITWGVPEPERAAELGANVTPADDAPGAFRFERSLELDTAGRYRVKMRLGVTSDALHAATRFHVEATKTAKNGRAYALVRCELETGRQHQIRVHLASLGAPIVGDKLYGPDEDCFARGADGELTEEDLVMLELPRHALHAARMAMEHPVLGGPLVMEAPLPPDLSAFWEGL
ncbi:MAG: RluA family pseudouridine synthase [Labilithrix sp.]|nr:RluA family pseudouridine synthase [Labilithrix sp.]MCW5816484.1 RluA family pseudouridine synthase [Labilithrix sp.]